MSNRTDRERVIAHLRGRWEPAADLIAWSARELDLLPSGVDLLLRDLILTGQVEARWSEGTGPRQREYRTAELPRPPARVTRSLLRVKAANARGAAMQRERLLAVLEGRGVVPLGELRRWLGYSLTTLRSRAEELAGGHPPRVRVHRDGDRWLGVELVR